MPFFRSLYAKIFGWFWLTVIASSLMVAAVTLFSGMQPIGKRWMRVTQDMYAHSAIDFYKSGGDQALRKYLAVLEASSGMHSRLLDSYGHDVLHEFEIPSVKNVLDISMREHRSNFELGRMWTAATPIAFEGQQYYFVVELHPFDKTFFNGQIFAAPFLVRLALVILVAGLFCLVLARHIVSPVRALQHAAQKLAAGDLDTRVLPAISPREDELAETARAFDKMADRMELLIRKRQELLADISHELRSPITRLSVSLELMRRGETDVLDQMETDLERMNDMIRQVLLLTRLDLQPPSSALERVQLASMIESIALDADFEAQSMNKSVVTHLDGDCTLLGDSNLLRSAIENIIRNAVHYTNENTTVEIFLNCRFGKSSQPECLLIVRDSGPGVPEESIPYLFDSFFRVSPSRDLREGGAGLGLSISQRVIERHRGTIHAANRNNQSGLEITVVLPVSVVAPRSL